MQDFVCVGYLFEVAREHHGTAKVARRMFQDFENVEERCYNPSHPPQDLPSRRNLRADRGCKLNH